MAEAAGGDVEGGREEDDAANEVGIGCVLGA